MAVNALGPEIVAELCAGRPTDPVPTILDDLSLTIERESVPGGCDMPSSSAVWVGYLRRIGATKLNAWGLSALVEDAQLLISELVTNGLRHGTGHEIVFRLVIGTDVLVLEVDDGSSGRPQVRDAGPDETNGRGMFLVDALAASWGVSADGTRTWCTLTKSVRMRMSR